uniref:TerD family protein n=1 Tax=Alloprevotella sp. TaxID=1872471 RepID=UPI004026E360
MGRFNLKKGDRFSLSKESGLNKIQVDLTWKSGADLDASAFLLGADGVIMDDADFVFYNSEKRSEPWNRDKFGTKVNWREETIPVSADGSVLGSADDLGDGEEDTESDDASETMHVILDKVNPKIREIIFCVTIYHGAGDDTTFGQVREPAIVITNEETGEELCRYDLKEKFSSETAVEAGKLVCNEDGEWEFEAMGQGYDGGMQTLIDMYA